MLSAIRVYIYISSLRINFENAKLLCLFYFEQNDISSGIKKSIVRLDRATFFDKI